MNGVEKIGSVFYFSLCNFYACRVWKAKYPRTSTPRMMRYTPNTAKLCLRTYSISPLMTSRLTTKETTQPTARIAHSAPVAETPESRNFTSFSTLAPSIVGMARKKENSAPAALPTPRMIAPRMVEPEREVPGIRLSHWKQPMSMAVFKSISYTEFA